MRRVVGLALFGGRVRFKVRMAVSIVVAVFVMFALLFCHCLVL